ncbi:hypothetical protein J1N35_037116 [Gossypium stocksii]|uniref:Reverse transcriptase domain-containing protein n=1 Tax=Gossypium stocksii TaxID=47602 RepID=A0A9D3UJF6_9ROSI|nr:hypothetical protein J1N35_037116 [Gossypium stocksii]
MDIENGYYLAKFQSIDDYTKVLSQGPCLIYGPWTKGFSPSEPYPSMVLVWIWSPGPSDQEVNVDDGLTMTSKPASLMSNLLDVQAADSSGGLNCNKHTAVSFKEKGPTDGVNKNQSTRKLMGGSRIYRTIFYLFRDRNTKFFDSRTMQRRKFNRILALRVSNGEWCSDKSILSNETVKFFENLYGENPSPMSDLPLNIFPLLKDQRDLVGGAVCERVQGIFAGNRIEGDLNNTLIVFIPKKDCPKDFSQFRPFSICSVMYKLVMKVIANRFKVVFPNFISPEQAGFITGRNISDNVIVTQEKVLNLGSYLGVPLLHDSVTKSTLNFVVEKVRSKLQNWEARKLSFAGLVTLAQSVLLAIPNYFM